MIKLIHAVIGVFFFIAASAATVFAAPAILPEVQFDPLTNGFAVHGVFENESRGNITVGLQVVNADGETVQVAVTTAVRSESGVTFAFEPILFFDNAQSCDYTFTVSSFLDSRAVTVPFLNVPDTLHFLKDLEQRDVSGIESALRGHGPALGLKMEDMDALSADSRKRLLADIDRLELGLEAITEDTPGYAALTRAAADVLVKRYRACIAVGLFNDCAGGGQAGQWLETYGAEYGFDKDDPATVYDENSIFNLYSRENTAGAVCERLAALSDMESIVRVKAIFYELVLCCTLDKSHVSAVDAFLNRYAAAFSIDLNKYTSVKNKAYVRKGLVNTGLFDYASVNKRFSELVENADKGSGGGQGGGGGGGTAGTGAPAVNLTDMPAETQPESQSPFDDLDAVPWARESIIRLYSLKIISGRGETKFAPNDNVTRAEAVKIIVDAFGLEKGGKHEFTDVPETAWYRDYVAAAAESGLVAGDDSGRFRPDDDITRQDLAVILYRAMKINASVPDAEFTDFASVSGYAKYAVNYFSRVKVINGYPDGRFAPLENATRAQAAKIIDTILNKK